MSSPEPPSDDRLDELIDGTAADRPPILIPDPGPPLIPEPLVPDPLVPAPPPAAAPGRPGTGTFTIEGRSAPGLFVVGWLATLLGIGLIAVAFLSGGSFAARILLVIALVFLSVGLVAGAGSQGIERRRSTRSYRGPSPLLVFVATIPLSLLAAFALSIPLRALDVDLDGPLAALLSVLIQAALYVGLIRLLVVDTGALTWAEMAVKPFDASALRDMAAGALWVVPVILATGIVARILLAIFPVSPTSPLPPTGTEIGFALSLIAGVLVAPFGEEIMFRAFATTAWVRGMNETNGLVLGALFFAFAHVLTVSGTSAGDAFQLAFVAFAGRLPVAFALGLLFIRRKSVWASFGLHATFNGLLLVIAEVASRSG
ncbi:MAG TPA: type II CAAX endopeptidase family protein [Actinomycetota bacterium]|nr:type II CAAX endopeptidase family protein [Actinomycetota bacterium]